MSDLISRADIQYHTQLEPMSNGQYSDVEVAYKNDIDALPSAEAVQIHNDGTLEVKVPNAQKVGRVLVMDTDSHIGGGLFYPDDAEAEWIPCSERLPSDSGNYLITVADFRLGHIGEHTVTIADFYAKGKKWNSVVDVVAWMPLPEPYREDGEA